MQTGARKPSEEIVRQFHRLYYGQRERTYFNTYWLGSPALKCPLDLWIYQELLFETRPDVLIETGTRHGGSALYLACIFDLLGAGRVMTIDTNRFDTPDHPRISYLTGSSVSPKIVAEVISKIKPGERVMVVLDSNHRKQHVLEELRIYSPLVTTGNYLVVEDTNINGHPVFEDFGPGPAEALQEFLAETDGFEVDPSCEKFFMTFNPAGFLKRVK